MPIYMWEFTYPQRIRQKEILSRIGIILLVAGFSIFIVSLLVFSFNFTFPYLEPVMFLGQFNIYLGACLAAFAALLAWNSSPFWDFIFNQLSIFLGIIGFVISWWNITQDNSIIQGMLIIFVSWGLIGLGRRFDSLSHKTNAINLPTSDESNEGNSITTQTPKRGMLDLKQPQIMKSVAGAIIWGFFGLVFSLIFRQPVIVLIAVLFGLLVGVDKKQESLVENLKVAFLSAIKSAVIGLGISAIIGAGFVGLFFGFDTVALLLGALIGGLIGFLLGALVGAL